MSKFRASRDFPAQAHNVAALFSLYAALESEGDCPLEPTVVVVFLAFSIESYINALGSRHLSIWSELERLPWRSKVAILFKTAGQHPEWGSGPLQFMSEVFSVRDKLAHGKPEHVFGPTRKERLQAWDDVEELLPDWLEKITKDWVLEAKSRHHALMTHLANLFGEKEDDYLHYSTGTVDALDA